MTKENRKIETKILRDIKNNRLNIDVIGERQWYNYYIDIIKLVWERNLHDGYKIYVYSDESKISHLTTIVI